MDLNANLQAVSSEGVVSFTIFLKHTKCHTAATTESLLFQCLQWEELGRDCAGRYVWNREQFHVVPGPVVNSFQTWTGRVAFGDCYQDEWLVVKILLEISKKFPDLILQVVDDDGDFVLIEAADHLQNWMTPENSMNCCFIKNGTFHLTLDAQTAQKHQSKYHRLSEFNAQDEFENSEKEIVEHTTRNVLKLHSAVPKDRFRAPKALEHQIYLRTSIFQKCADSLNHVQRCAIPAKLAFILSEFETCSDEDRTLLCCDIVSLASSAFYHRDADQVRAANRMIHFPPDDLVVFPVRFSRMGFAKLLRQKYFAPRKFQQFIPKEPVGTNSGPQPTEQDFANYLSATVGMKLTCAFEILFTTALSLSDSKPIISHVDSKNIPQVVGKKSGEIQNALKSNAQLVAKKKSWVSHVPRDAQPKLKSFLELIRNIDLDPKQSIMLSRVLKISDNEAHHFFAQHFEVMDNILRWKKSLKRNLTCFQERTSHRLLQHIVWYLQPKQWSSEFSKQNAIDKLRDKLLPFANVPTSRGVDGDSGWLDLAPESLEILLQNSSKNTCDGGKNNLDRTNDSATLPQGIFDGIQRLLNNESGFEGVGRSHYCDEDSKRFQLHSQLKQSVSSPANEGGVELNAKSILHLLEHGVDSPKSESTKKQSDKCTKSVRDLNTCKSESHQQGQQFSQNTWVQIVGLQSKKGAVLNGMHAKILHFDQKLQRYAIQLRDAGYSGKLLKPVNLRKLHDNPLPLSRPMKDLQRKSYPQTASTVTASVHVTHKILLDGDALKYANVSDAKRSENKRDSDDDTDNDDDNDSDAFMNKIETKGYLPKEFSTQDASFGVCDAHGNTRYMSDDEAVSMASSAMDFQLRNTQVAKTFGPAANDDATISKKKDSGNLHAQDNNNDEENISDAEDASDLLPMNLDMNLVENLLASYKLQDGLPGPTSTLLSDLGIALPDDDDESDVGI